MVSLRQVRMAFCKSRLQKVAAIGITFTIICCIVYAYGSSSDSPTVGMERAGDDPLGGPVRWSGGPAGHPHRKRHKLMDEAVGQMAACLSPSLILLNSTVEKLDPTSQLTCGQKDIFTVLGRYVQVKSDVLGRQKLSRCRYLGIEWTGDSSFKYVDLGEKIEEPFIMEITEHDFVRVRCYLHNSELKKMRKLLVKEQEQEAFYSDSHDTKNKDTEDSPRYLGSVGLPDPPSINRLRTEHNLKKTEKLKDSRKSLQHKTADSKNNTNSNNLKHSNKSKPKTTSAKVDGYKVEDIVKSTMRQTRKEILPKPVRSGRQWKQVKSSSLHDAADYDQFIAMIHRHPEVFERLDSDSAPDTDSLKMDVLVLNVEGLSQRDIPHILTQTYTFLMSQLKAVVLNTYNSAGETKAEALFPLITGRPLSDFPEALPDREESMFLDSLPFIWKKFEQDGYATLFAEDMPHLNALQAGLTGLEHMPTDHFMRTFWLAASESPVQKGSRNFCLGGKPIYEHTLDYLKHFYQQYKDVNKFTLASVGYHAKDSLVARYMDAEIYNLLKTLAETGALDRTLVILMSDHGTVNKKQLHTLETKLAARHPFMALSLPKWFHDKYPELVDTVKMNSGRLTTPFDIFSTLKDLLDIKRVKEPITPERGTSLFRKIPLNRTCQQASIPMHWCACLTLEPEDVRRSEAVECGKVLLDHVNNLVRHLRKDCDKLQVSAVKDFNILTANEQAMKHQSPEADRKREQNTIFYHVTIKTSPNDALYQATVEHNPDMGTYNVINSVQRTNRYGRSGRCIAKQHPELRKFCHCTDED